MRSPDYKIETNSTLDPLPRRQLLVKFLASLMLFGFLLGLMLGRLTEPPRQYAHRVIQVQAYADGLAVCLSAPAEVQSSTLEGAYQLLLQDTLGESAQGELILGSTKGSAEPIRWLLEQHNGDVRLIFVGLQPLRGRWQPRVTETLWCADIQVRLAQ